MLLAGSDTAATAMEWAVSLLLNNPTTMNKLRVELNTYVGHDQLLNELGTAKLRYLQNVITETLRLCPVLRFLYPTSHQLIAKFVVLIYQDGQCCL